MLAVSAVNTGEEIAYVSANTVISWPAWPTPMDRSVAMSGSSGAIMKASVATAKAPKASQTSGARDGSGVSEDVVGKGAEDVIDRDLLEDEALVGKQYDRSS